MGIENNNPIFHQLIKYWEKQNIEVVPKSINEIENLKHKFTPIIPTDFIEFYSMMNGMQFLYPNDMDNEGFLFYPLEGIISVKDEFENSTYMSHRNIMIFAEYMHKSWWYGVEVKKKCEYVIGIIPTKDSFQPITKSLSHFIQLYVENSSVLYDYT